MSTYLGPNLVTDGLVLNLDAANVESYPGTGNNWLDLSGRGNNGTLVNGPTFNSNNFGSLYFDGINDYVTTGSLLITGNTSWTIDIWLNVSSSEIGSGRRGWILWKGVNLQEENNLISLSVTNGYLEVAHWINDTVFLNTPIKFDKFQNLTVAFDGSTEYIYSDGINTDSKTLTLNVTDGIWYSGCRAGAFDFLNFGLSHLKIYNRFLNNVEIQQNYQAIKSRFRL